MLVRIDFWFKLTKQAAYFFLLFTAIIRIDVIMSLMVQSEVDYNFKVYLMW